MNKLHIFGLLSLFGIISLVLYDVGQFNAEMTKLTAESSPISNTYLSPHAKIQPTSVDYGLVAEVPEPEVLGKAVSFNLTHATPSCTGTTLFTTIEWSKHHSARRYVVQKKQKDAKRWLDISVTLPGDTTIFQDRNVVVASTYTYRVKAWVGKRIVYSNTVETTVPDCTSAQPVTAKIEDNDSNQTADQNISETEKTQTTVTVRTEIPVTPNAAEDLTTTPVSNTGLTWGAFNGWKIEDGPAFETAVGKKLLNRAVFVHWGNESDFPSYLGPTLAQNNATLTIFWEAMDYNGHLTDQPRFSYDAILRGDWDTYITNFAESARKYGQPVILIPFEEMNGNWNPWAGTKNGNSAEKHKAAFRYIHKFFVSATNVKFGWAVNQVSVPDVKGNQLEDYYPGGEYVDYVGVDGFNFGSPWLSFAEVFDSSLKRLNAYGKPIYIFSMASAEGAKKAEWIRDALTVQIPKYERLVGWVWFNEKKERDWRVWSDSGSLSAFKEALP